MKLWSATGTTVGHPLLLPLALLMTLLSPWGGRADQRLPATSNSPDKSALLSIERSTTSPLAKPTWAANMVLFGVTTIDGTQTAFFGSGNLLSVLSLSIGEKLPNGMELRAVREKAGTASIAAELALGGETAIVESLWESDDNASTTIIEPAPTTKLPLPATVPLVFSAAESDHRSAGKVVDSSTNEKGRPAVVAWPRKIEQ